MQSIAHSTTRPASTLWRTGLIALAALGAATGVTADETPPGQAGSPTNVLDFSQAEGRTLNRFIRADGVAAHISVRPVPSPRLVVAFPAGNSGAALFFQAQPSAPDFEAPRDVTPVRTTRNGTEMSGVRFHLRADTPRLALTRGDAGSIRFLRGAVDPDRLPARPDLEPVMDGQSLTFTRTRPDGESRYSLKVTLKQGTIKAGENAITFEADASGTLDMDITALTGDTPLSGLDRAALLSDGAGPDTDQRNALAFLTYQEKMLAGSWRFLTYFGRDTLLSARLLTPVLTPRAASVALHSVLARLSPAGGVAHEEEIGELAVYRNMAETGEASAAPVYDYDMVDDNLMLAPLVAAYLDRFGPARIEGMLAKTLPDGRSAGAALMDNLALVTGQAAAFADHPGAANLVSIRDGLQDGNWRDSEEGLAGGRIPYDVNAVLMPAALRATATLMRAGLVSPSVHLPAAERVAAMATIWQRRAPSFFTIERTPAQTRQAVESLTTARDLPAISKRIDDPVRFPAVALAGDGTPIPVMHSDVGYDLLFSEPDTRRLGHLLNVIVQPFPLGLATDVGVLSANPAFANEKVRALVTRNHYHGTTIWSWQQAMIIAGLDRQLARSDVPEGLKSRMADARDQIMATVRRSRALLNSELWTWSVQGGSVQDGSVQDGRYVPSPFGQGADHLTESNPVQLWSTVFLGVADGQHRQVPALNGNNP
ncbi:hypothetical protein [Yunchengibacter salinarum]|uniref:hypothetical protein n=1 Tax=Yunchengibacter salinarum TaxID=3133399 RepID=UPI0035B5D7AE